MYVTRDQHTATPLTRQPLRLNGTVTGRLRSIALRRVPQLATEGPAASGQDTPPTADTRHPVREKTPYHRDILIQGMRHSLI
jgi:hypothetical protein